MECQKQVAGFTNANYKSFKTLQAAKAWLQSRAGTNVTSLLPPKLPEDYEWVFWSDGGCRNHGNQRGGRVKKNDVAAWAFLLYDGSEKVVNTAGEFGATNNKMELLGLINALEALIARKQNTKRILAVLDSKYVLDGITKGWLKKWQLNNWQTNSGAVKNQPQWERLLELLPQFPGLMFMWTKGHADDWGNNLVDGLLNEKMDELLTQQHR